ncbi:MAG: RHS repeat-associated core domain-containing protein [Pseudonocardiales bacterium]
MIGRAGAIPRRFGWLPATMTLLLAVSLGCTATHHRGASAASRLALEQCDPLQNVACEHQAALLNVPVPGSGLALVYSSEWAAGRQDRPGWEATALGLGAWGLDVVQRYDPKAKVLLQGDGQWRLVAPVPVGHAEHGIATPDGARVYVFDQAERHGGTVDAITGAVLLTVAYDSKGRLATVNGALDGRPIHLVVQRSATGTPVGLVGADAARTTVFLDAGGYLADVSDPSGAATHMVTSPRGLVQSEADPASHLTEFSYDKVGRLSSVKDADGRVRALSYRASENSTEIRVTTATLVSIYRFDRIDSSTMRRSVTTADGATTTMTTSDGTRRLALPDGTTFTTDSKPDQRWGSQAPLLTPVVEARSDGTVRRTEIHQTVTTEPGLPLQVTAWSTTTTDSGKKWVQTYDPTEHSVTLTDPAGRKSITGFDSAGRIVHSTAPGRPQLTVVYDKDGRVSRETRGAGAAAAITTYAYERATGIMSTTRPDGHVERVAFDGAGRPTRQINPSGSAVDTRYDATGRTVSVRPPGRPAHTLGSSATGLVTGYLPPIVADDRTSEIRTYDAGGQLATIEGPGTRHITLAHDQQGRLTSWNSSSGATKLDYDPKTALLAKSMTTDQLATAYGYTGSDPVALSWTGPVTGAVRSTLDPQGRALTETATGSPAIRFDYDPAGILTAVGDLRLDRDPTSGNATRATLGLVQTTIGYDAAGRVARSTTRTRGAVLLDIGYQRDAMGRVVAITEQRSRTTTRTTFTYDTADRLASVNTDGATQTYGYDTVGNRITVAGPAASTASYDDRDRLVKSGGTTFTYAPGGALIRRGAAAAVTTYQTDDFGQLRAVVLPGGRHVTYLVDAAGRRVGRQVNGAAITGYLYRPDGHVVAQLDSHNTIIVRFAYDDLGRLAWLQRDGHTYRVVTDQLGSPLLVIDTRSGAVAQSLTYDTSGTITADTKPGFQPFGFTGGLSDPDTGLVHLGARDYDPAIGRWTSPDPIRFNGGDANLYRYAAGDPVNRTDPSGLEPTPGEGAAASAVGPTPNRHFGSDVYYHDPRGGCILAFCDVPRNGTFRCFGLLCDGTSERGLGLCEFGYCSVDLRGNFLCVALVCAPPSNSRCGGICGESYGDPHLRTGDGGSFDFQGSGEYVVAQTPDRSVVVQARVEPLPGQQSVTFNAAIAVRVGGARVAVYVGGDRRPRVDGVPVEGEDVSVALAGGGTLERYGRQVTISSTDGTRIVITHNGEYLDYVLAPSAKLAATLRGLLGRSDGIPANDLTARDGTVLQRADREFRSKLYHQFGDSWRITQAESLFDYAPGQSTATFTHREIPKAAASVASLKPADRLRATALCRSLGITIEPVLSNCILDVAITGDPTYAASAAAAAARSLGTRPAKPNPTNVQSKQLVIGDTVSGNLAAIGDIDRYTFTATAGQPIYLDHQSNQCLEVDVVDPTGIPVTRGELCNSIGPLTLTAGGTYRIDIYRGNDADGTYKFHLLAVAATRTTAIAIGDTVADTLQSKGAISRYTFTARPGQVIYLDQQSNPCIPVDVLDPTGIPVTRGELCNSIGPLTLTAGGTYRIDIYRGNDADGTYKFHLRAG